jgi:hypothetical protein
VRRLVMGLAGFALISLACACGSSVGQPSVTVAVGPVLESSGHVIYVFLLTPTGRPSGVVTLHAIRDGHTRRLGYVRFAGMTGMGSAAVEVTSRGIVPFWTVPSSDSGSATGFVAFPARSVSDTTAWAGFTATREDIAAGQTPQVFWTQDRYVGHAPASGGTLCGGPLDAVVLASKATPRKTSYCLTITVGGK